ncbi:hypothetical protein MLD38_011113 [Melastoma candidum]|uniref:Uncharacterized protein n=1 Tax=Melastoma candidum TaxID=119954 RepID=A0ACB9R5H9_9MYRT|nr:hypothetical protein MLD38_011113 [Melastoma candidum]
MAAWPVYEEQQLNAFQLVKEMGLAAEIRIDFKRVFKMESGDTVSSEEIGQGIRTVMEESGEKRRKMKEWKDMSRSVLKKGSHPTWR